MSVEYTWKINDIRSTTSTGEVFEVIWVVRALRGTCQASYDGKTSLVTNPNQLNFIPFENLTEEQVILWVKNVVNVSNIEELALQALNTLHPPEEVVAPIRSGVPWGGI
jgi:hypothetical protein